MEFPRLRPAETRIYANLGLGDCTSQFCGSRGIGSTREARTDLLPSRRRSAPKECSADKAGNIRSYI